MYASVVSAPIHSDKSDELASLYQVHVVALVGGESGLMSAHLVRAGDDAISIGIHESEPRLPRYLRAKR